jgi:diaminopimelate epimerase
MKDLKFVKAVATGNDFIIIENRNRFNNEELVKIAQILCRPKYGIGADGLLVSEDSKVADLKMRIFNPDGTEAEMCGNGIRCFSLWAFEEKKVKSLLFKIETISGIINSKIVNGNRVKVDLVEPKDIVKNIKLEDRSKIIEGDFVNTGVPHFIIESKELEKEDVIGIGRFIRNNKIFKPEGTNVDFIQYLENKLLIRTYERGVENETLACGTGCVAGAVIFGIKNKLQGEIILEVLPRSGEQLKVGYSMNGEIIKNVWLEGEANLVFEGQMKLEFME